MNKSTLAIAVAVGLLAQQANAAGFIEDSKATLKLRNFYINNDNRDSGTAKNANYQEEWGQGFQLDFTSGFTQGTVGFGVDAIGLLGVRLDSGKGRHGNPASSNYGGTVFPTDSDGRAVSDFSSLGLTAKAKISQTELRYGTLMPKLPVVSYNDGRLLPQTFEGGQITSNEFKDLTLIGGQIEHAKGRNSSNNEELSIAGANNARTGEFSNKFLYGGADYKLNKDLLLQYYYGNLKDFYKQHFLGLTHNWAIGPGVLKSDLRYFHSTDDGKNGSDPAYYSSGDYRGQVSGKGKVDNNLLSGLFLYSVEGHTFGAGYQVSNGSSDFPWLNQGDGSSAYIITDMQISKFARAGERTWQARYSYDFAKLGAPGLTAGLVYLRGDNIDTVGSAGQVTGTGRSEWERDITLAYVVQDGPLKNLGVMWKNAMWRNDIPSTRDQDENRLIVSYSIPLL
ncbi:OprD family porin [Pseudomonas helleri]|uniref:Outer membrane porin, OprD family n=1 Tax=Pseudomonas helleri TaxID=1608996 RepID=A0A6A7YUV4_9PSED|nr:OprD family porin [Pseudomonas helleri]MQT24384.1 outer membrane porin, OprD family [Pseudomonas helleri]MQT78990.1 outer membrane porin, OprD family [Pseudomonas helleri]MQU15366.1 outer membrane porin, OprD family [Pseudomonas helleri]MQU25593.1 outer membrane porin, OprD family [Pseudomonas helleri]